MTVGAFPDEASDGSADELDHTAMHDRDNRQSKDSGRSQGNAASQGRASTEAVVGSSAKQVVEEGDTMASSSTSALSSKSVHCPTRITRNSRLLQPEKQPESSAWSPSGVTSLLKSLVGAPSDVAEAQKKQILAQLDESKTRVKTLEAQLREQIQYRLKQQTKHEQDCKDVEAKAIAEVQRIKDRCNQHYKKLHNEYQTELHRLKHAHKQDLASQRDPYERRLESAKLENARIIEGSRTAAASANEQIDRFRKTCREYEEKLDMQDSTISRMQSAQFKSIEASHWAPLESSEIEGKLSSIQTRVRKWTSDHAMSTLDQILDPQGFSHSLNELVKRGCVLNPERLRERLLQSKSMRKPGKAAAVLLGAAIMHDIMLNIIAKPFFAFLGRPKEPLLGANQAAELSMLFEHIGTYDQAGAEGLRCQILRLLDPPTKDGINNVAGDAKLMARNSRGRAVAELTINIIDGFLGPLTGEERHQALDGLSGIVEEAAMLSWSFWTRKTMVCALPWTRIQSTPPGPLSYHSNSDLLEPHTMHNLLLEDEPQALDGREVVLCCSPALTIFGNAEGGEYHKYKVLKKAVVWMG